jgi:hypothetical protein
MRPGFKKKPDLTLTGIIQERMEWEMDEYYYVDGQMTQLCSGLFVHTV